MNVHEWEKNRKGYYEVKETYEDVVCEISQYGKPSGIGIRS